MNREEEEGGEREERRASRLIRRNPTQIILEKLDTTQALYQAVPDSVRTAFHTEKSRNISIIMYISNFASPQLDSDLVLHTPLDSFVSLTSVLSLSPHSPPLLLHLANPFRNRFRTEFFESPTSCDVCNDEQ